jgi:hypothetical protein
MGHKAQILQEFLEWSFVPSPEFTIRERADPKGPEGGGGLRIRPRKAARGSRRSARKSARGSGEPHASLHAGPEQPRRPACTGLGGPRWSSRRRRGRRAFPRPRLWKLTGCGKLRAPGHLPRTFPQPLESRPPPPPRDFHSSHSLGERAGAGRKRTQIAIFL